MSIIDSVFDEINKNENLESAFTHRIELNEEIVRLLNIYQLNEDQIEQLRRAIIIGNATYTNCPTETLPIDDGVWDLMVGKYRKYTPDNSYPVGYKDIKTATQISEQQRELQRSVEKKKLFSVVPEEDIERMKQMLYSQEILQPNYFVGPITKHLFERVPGRRISKRLTDTTHNHPELVGTFDKCKFVLNSQAREAGVFDDPSVNIMERDFFGPLLEAGVINYETEFTMIATIKYDGISVEADVTDRVLSARTRGDAMEDEASDITPILGGYRFSQLTPDMIQTPIGMKFEAIINDYNLYRFGQMKEYAYKNSRTAMTGIVGSSDGYLYRDLVTLVPISTDMKDENGDPLDRLVEIEFLNKYYATDELLRYAVLTGNYTSILFQIKKFVEEAEFARSYIPFMYDGVVFEFYDKDIRKLLGRDNAMDRYKCAIKFNPLVKQTIFTGYYFTVGQDGTITPMICYTPVEFFGTIHPNSSGHSYKTFKELDLHVGDVIDVTYRNDVITYVTKPDNEHNRINAQNPYTELDSFPTHCPFCGVEIEISESGKSARCPNFECPERSAQRMAATMAKLGIVNFGLESVKALGMYHLYEYIDAINSTNGNPFEVLGPNSGMDLKQQFMNIMNNTSPDYKVFGALGFDNMADKTWKTILTAISYKDLFFGIAGGDITEENFPKIKGIGAATVKTILNEFKYFQTDIGCIFDWFNLSISYGKANTGKQIRFTGFRNRELEEQLNSMGHDCDGNAGVTKSTSYLLVPHEGYNQGSKCSKAMKYGVPIVSVQTFMDNLDQYL